MGAKGSNASVCPPGGILGAEASKWGDVWVTVIFRLYSGPRGRLPLSQLEKEAAPRSVSTWHKGSKPTYPGGGKVNSAETEGGTRSLS